MLLCACVFHCLYYTRVACNCQGFFENFVRVACKYLDAHTALCCVGAFLFVLRCAFVVSPGGLKKYTGRKGRGCHVAQV
nr:MAG TPA: hypothetical protein [Caudoviricetes sp.]